MNRHIIDNSINSSQLITLMDALRFRIKNIKLEPSLTLMQRVSISFDVKVNIYAIAVNAVRR